MRKYYYLAVVALILVGGGYYLYTKTQANKSKTQYVTAPVEKNTITSSVSASGNIIVDQSSTVDPTISGTVSNLSVQVGDKVQEGQHLFDIVNDDLSVNVDKSNASLEQAKSSLEANEAAEKQAKADLSSARHKNNTTPGSFTKKQIVAMQEKLDAAEKGVTASEQALVAAQADLANEQTTANKRNVTAPISGTVNSINIKNGDDIGKISSGTTHVSPIIIGNLNTMKAQVQVNEVDIPKVKNGQKVMLTFDAIDGFTATGKVEKMDSLGTITQNVVTYNVTIDFDNLDERIKPQMSVSASIITDVKSDVLTVPNSAIRTQGSNSYVEVMKGGSQTPEQAFVQTGLANNTNTEITSGLNAGDVVVTQTISGNSNSNTNNSGSGSNRGGGFGVPGFGGGGGGGRFR